MTLISCRIYVKHITNGAKKTGEKLWGYVCVDFGVGGGGAERSANAQRQKIGASRNDLSEQFFVLARSNKDIEKHCLFD